MNLETLDLLTQKIDKALSTIRNLRSENQRLQETSIRLDSQMRLVEGQLAASKMEQERLEVELDIKVSEAANLTAELARKEQELQSMQGEVEQRVVELNRLQDALREKEEKIQSAANRLEQVMNSLEIELDVRIEQPEEVVDSAKPFQEEKAFEHPQDLFGFSTR